MPLLGGGLVPPYGPLAWFTAFGPYEKPEICVVVFVEYGGKGGRVAAPIAAKILKAYFK